MRQKDNFTIIDVTAKLGAIRNDILALAANLKRMFIAG